MSVITKIDNEIARLYEMKKTIQEQCSHPESVLTKVARSNTGNYDPSNDSYWYECACDLCGKKWHEDQ